MAKIREVIVQRISVIGKIQIPEEINLNFNRYNENVLNIVKEIVLFGRKIEEGE